MIFFGNSRFSYSQKNHDGGAEDFCCTLIDRKHRRSGSEGILLNGMSRVRLELLGLVERLREIPTNWLV